MYGYNPAKKSNVTCFKNIHLKIFLTGRIPFTLQI